MEKTKLSIITPMYNEEKTIIKLLKSISNQSYKNFEIILVDDGSTDKTLEKVREFSKNSKIKAKILQQNHKGPGIARNLGANIAKGEILIFVDSDMVLDKNYLKYLIKPILEKNVIGTEEETQIAKNAEYNIWAKCFGKIVTNPHNKDRKIFRAIRKDQFLEMGGFDPKYGYADDQTFWFKYKQKSRIAKKAFCYHDNPDTLKKVYLQSRWIGASIENPFLNYKLTKFIFPIILLLISPIPIFILSLRKSFKNKDFKILFPWMFIFMTMRYLGTIHGLVNKIYFKKNIR